MTLYEVTQSLLWTSARDEKEILTQCEWSAEANVRRQLSTHPDTLHSHRVNDCLKTEKMGDEAGEFILKVPLKSFITLSFVM